MDWIKGLLNYKKIKKENEKLKVDLKECGQKLIERQEAINKTNAYWKKKFYDLKNKSGL